MMLYHRRIAALALLTLSAGIFGTAAADGDPLPKHARLRLGTLRFRHGGTVTELGFFPGGKTLFSFGDDGPIRFWEADTGKELRHVSPPTGGVLSPDGKTVAILEIETGKQYQVVRLWDVSTSKLGQPLSTNRQVGTNFSSVIFSPDSKLVAAVEHDANNQNSVLHVWETATGRELDQFRPPPPKEENQPAFQTFSCHFSPDGKVLVAAGNDADGNGKLHTWDVASGKLLPPLDDTIEGGERVQILFRTGSMGQVHQTAMLSFAPDGQTLAGAVAVTDKEGGTTVRVRLWQPTTGRRIRDFDKFDGVLGLRFSARGKTLAVVPQQRQSVRLFDCATGKELTEATLDNVQVDAVTFSPDGKLLAIGGSDAAARLWDVAAGKELHQLKGYQTAATIPQLDERNVGQIYSLVFSPDGQTLVGTGGVLIRRWKVATGEEIRSPDDGHAGAIMAVLLTPDGKQVLTVGNDNTAKLWDAQTGKELRSFEGPPSDPTEVASVGLTVGAAALTPDGKTLAVGWPTGLIQLFEVATAKELHQLKGHDYGVNGLTFAENGKALISTGHDGRALWWDTENNKVLRQFAGSPVKEDTNDADVLPGPVHASLSPDGRTVAVAAADDQYWTLQLLETATGKPRRQFRVKLDANTGIGASPPNFARNVIGAADLLDQTQFGAVVFAPDGKTLAWTTGNTVRLWDAMRGKEVRRFGVADGTPLSVVFAPDGKYLAAACAEGAVYVWETATGTVLGQMAGHRGGTLSTAFAMRGMMLASGGVDTTVLLWDVADFLATPAAAPGALSAAQVKDLWQRLARDDGEAAYDAQLQLAAAPAQALPWLREQTKPVMPPDARHVARLIEQLEDNRFGVRKKATDELERLGELAAPALKKRLAENPSLEVKQRIDKLLQQTTGPVTHPERLQALRAVEVLEQIGTAEAQEVLREVAKGAPAARLTREAQAALDRLGKGKP